MQEINLLANDLLHEQTPTLLHHYTSVNGVKGIANSRSLWATCLAEQSDTQELNAAIQILDGIAARYARESGGFVSLVLHRLASAISERRRWLFITCFCADDDSKHHWNEYGRYRLDVPVHDGSRFLIEPKAFEQDCWMRPCVYSADEFANVAERAIVATSTSLQKYV